MATEPAQHNVFKDEFDPAGRLEKWAKRYDVRDTTVLDGIRDLLADVRRQTLYFNFDPGTFPGWGACAVICDTAEKPDHPVKAAALIISGDGKFNRLDINAPSSSFAKATPAESIKDLISKAIATKNKTGENSIEVIDFSNKPGTGKTAITMALHDLTQTKKFEWRIPKKKFWDRFRFPYEFDLKLGHADIWLTAMTSYMKDPRKRIDATLSMKADFFNKQWHRLISPFERTKLNEGDNTHGYFNYIVLRDMIYNNGKQQEEKWLSSLPADARHALKETLLRMERNRFHRMQTAFMRHMDSEALLLMRRTGTIAPLAYNWLMADGDGVKKERRAQAIQSHPLLAKNLMDDENLTEIIDTAQQLAPVLRQNFNPAKHKEAETKNTPLKPATLKRIAGLYRPVYAARLGNYTDLLDALPTAWWPEGKQEWKDFHKVADASHTFADITDKKPTDVIQEPRGRWAAYADAIGNDKNIRDIADFINNIGKILVTPALTRSSGIAGKNIDPSFLRGSNKIFNPIFKNESMIKMIEASRRWHERLETFRARIRSIGAAEINTSRDSGDTSKEISWIPLSPKVTAPNGLVIEELTTKDELDAEAEMMKHCVDGYLPKSQRSFTVYEDWVKATGMDKIAADSLPANDNDMGIFDFQRRFMELIDAGRFVHNLPPPIHLFPLDNPDWRP